MKYAALLALLLSGTAAASSLADLKAALAGMQGQGSLKGTFEARQTKTEEDAPKPETTTVSVKVEDAAGELRIGWDRAVLQRAMEASLRSPKPDSDLAMAINANSANRISAAVNYASRLLNIISTGQVKAERMDTWQGKPARMIEVAYTPPVDANGSLKMKENAHTAKVWLGADGIPAGALLTHSVRASFMVFISYEEKSTESYTFAHIGNRLVALRREEQGVRKGAGQDGTFRNLYTFTPQ
ncbi:hypothetical protein [Pseudoduganella sp. GCM10020061]|uniref:hypothetical protein n=1 Tax=Pseudoduganella sp. GCM10020061 TaxID=3317345 RepID=UPI00362E0406